MLRKLPGLFSSASSLQVPGLWGCPVRHRGTGQPGEPA